MNVDEFPTDQLDLLRQIVGLTHYVSLRRIGVRPFAGERVDANATSYTKQMETAITSSAVKK